MENCRDIFLRSAKKKLFNWNEQKIQNVNASVKYNYKGGS